MYAVIIAGGRGTRFWPCSRATRPKQLLDLLGEQTMIQQTVARIEPLVPLERILVVTAADQSDAIAAQVPHLPAANIIAEPCGRNTAAAICLAALQITARSPGATMVVLPADHYIADPAGLRACIAAAAEAAARTGALVTMGIVPDGPETGYGYMQCGEAVGTFAGQDFFRVARFTEKPDRATAEAFLLTGEYLWNSGMFVWTVGSILAAIEKLLPELAGALRAAPEQAEGLAAAYARINPVSIDVGVMERADSVLTLKADFGWNDIGSWAAMQEVLPRDSTDNAVRGDALAVEAHGCVIYSPRKLTAVIGLDDVIVVDTPDALLVCSKDRAQDVRSIVEALERAGRTELI